MSVMMLECKLMLPYATNANILESHLPSVSLLSTNYNACMVASLELSITTSSQSCMCFWLMMENEKFIGHATTQLAECCTIWFAKIGCC